MASNEIMNDAELDNVVGGSGIECIALLGRLQEEGLYTPSTPLIQGNERAAAKELKEYLATFKRPDGYAIFMEDSRIYSGSTPNLYVMIREGGFFVTITADQLIQRIKELQS